MARMAKSKPGQRPANSSSTMARVYGSSPVDRAKIQAHDAGFQRKHKRRVPWQDFKHTFLTGRNDKPDQLAQTGFLEREDLELKCLFAGHQAFIFSALARASSIAPTM